MRQTVLLEIKIVEKSSRRQVVAKSADSILAQMVTESVHSATNESRESISRIIIAVLLKANGASSTLLRGTNTTITE